MNANVGLYSISTHLRGFPPSSLAVFHNPKDMCLGERVTDNCTEYVITREHSYECLCTVASFKMGLGMLKLKYLNLSITLAR